MEGLELRNPRFLGPHQEGKEAFFTVTRGRALRVVGTPASPGRVDRQ